MLPKKSRYNQRVYLDHASATPLAPQVFEAMRPYFTQLFANPSALYGIAVEARQAIEKARESVAGVLGTQSDSIFFTSGGTESTNLAIFGVMKKLKTKKGARPHIITTQIEHHSVLHAIEELEREGCEVTYLPVNQAGQIDIAELKRALRPMTALVSIMYANNEIGTIEPIAQIGREILKWRKANHTPYPYFHTDACQAGPYLDLHVEKLHVDLLSLNGSKVYGPKGVGVLYKRRGVELYSQMFGGGQEFGLRSGTENVPGIVGLAQALLLVQKNKHNESKRIKDIRDLFWKQLKKQIPDSVLNGPPCEDGPRLPNNLHVTFYGADAEAMILYLDAYGIVCSSGSACTTDSDEASHVLLACGRSSIDAQNSLRFTLGKSTKKQDVRDVMKYLPAVVREVREMKE